MKFERLRLSGFKTFVEPVDIAIAPGLTGIVGPNGCGKSNLVEALRWAMGETSSKSLRGAGMEDVIFAGSTTRPERNNAEVSLRIGDLPEDLPGHLSGAETLEISRKIVREQGSTYRINGREVRARDVQILFADAASGARSPSLVRQGQISELIAAKPQHRRRILEDAAGIAGLHTRRHEAELRLKGTEENLARLADILTQYERQRGDLKRQARQAERYKALAGQIRTLELAILAAGHAAARAEAAGAADAHDAALRTQGMALVAQGESERARALAEHDAESARKAHGEALAELSRLSNARATLDAELAHVTARLTELSQRQQDARRDAESSAQLLLDAQQALARLANEQETLAAQIEQAEQGSSALQARLAGAMAARAHAEQASSREQQRIAEANAARRAAEQRLAEAEARETRLSTLTRTWLAEKAALEAGDAELARLPGLSAALTAAEEAVEQAAQAHAAAEAAVHQARAGEQAARPGVAETERLVQRLETELRTIRKLVDNSEPGLWTPAVDRITVQPGFETALAAALGEDLDAAIEPGAPRHWAQGPLAALPALPEGAAPLLAHVEAPGALHARLSQIGVVEAEVGEALAAHLKPGQRLVSRKGDLWRWDGFSARAEAPSPAARRLAERNRLADLEAQAQVARHKRENARAVLDGALKGLRQASAEEASTRDSLKRAQTASEAVARALGLAKNASEAARLKLESVQARIEATSADAAEAREQRAALRAMVDSLAPMMQADDALRAAQDHLESVRRTENEVRADASRFESVAQTTRNRMASLRLETSEWQARATRAEDNAQALAARVAYLADEEAALVARPDALGAQRLILSDAITAGQVQLSEASDRLAEAETRLRQTSEAARNSLAALADARSQTARLQALREHAFARLAEITKAIEVQTDSPVEALPAPPPAQDPHSLQITLDDLKGERDKLGAVNLRAEIELCEIEKEYARLEAERLDVEKAITRLRRAIDQLNAEGRTRLRAAFEKVDVAFRRLFSRLFGGGTAQLQLMEAEDPLEAGLEILAHPPGKKPQLLSLLSGGEQALTATALIFAVFLTNPAPICVLDEVDAPLDDANVERLCDLLVDMAQETQTRFLVITHNPISMARMDRLYGVTMIERGISQVVSVDLASAEALAQAG